MSELSKPENKSHWNPLRSVLGILIGLIILAIAVVALLLVRPPSWLVKDILIRAAQEYTQQQLTVNGRADLTVYPDIHLTLNDIKLADTPKNSLTPEALAPPAVVAERAQVDINLVSLWNRQFEVPRIKLIRPVITIKPGAPLMVNVAEGKVDVGLPKVIEIEHGTINITGNTVQEAVSLEDVTAVLTYLDEGNGIAFNGHISVLGKPIAFNGKIADLLALSQGKSSPLNFLIENEVLKATVEGEMATQPVGQFDGQLTASTTQLSNLLNWAGIEQSQSSLGETASIDAHVVTSTRRITLEPANLKLEAIDAVLSADISLEQDRPAITASLTTDSLDINKLLPAASPAASLEVASSQEIEIIPSAWDDLIDQLKGRQPSFAAVSVANSIWKTEPFSLADFPAADIDLSVKAKTISYGRLPFKNGVLAVKSRQRRLEVAIESLELEQGNVQGGIAVDIEREHLKSAVNLKFEKLALDTLLHELAGRRVMSGVGEGQLDVNGKGANMRALVGSLNGTAIMSAAQGELIGIDLRRAVYHLGAPQTYDPKRRTKFNRLKGSFNIRNGVLRSSENLKLFGPEVDISSSGSYGLISRRLDQRVNLTLKPPPIEFPIPLRVLGTLENPKISWDIFKAVSNSSRFATPFSIAPPTERMSSANRADLQNILTQEGTRGGRKISPQAKRFLENLLGTR